jgi:hypothetical protein
VLLREAGESFEHREVLPRGFIQGRLARRPSASFIQWGTVPARRAGCERSQSDHDGDATDAAKADDGPPVRFYAVNVTSVSVVPSSLVIFTTKLSRVAVP